MCWHLYTQAFLKTTGKSDNGGGHLSTILGRGDGNLNDQLFKSSNSRGLPKEEGGGGGGGGEVSS